MGRYVVNNQTGEEMYQQDDGTIVPVPAGSPPPDLAPAQAAGASPPGRLMVNNQTGQEVFQHGDGTIIPVDEAGLLAQAGRQFADLGSGIKSAYGQLTDQPGLVNSANAETQMRNRLFAGTDAAHPWQAMLGQALPGIATAPMGGWATGIGLGAAESALDLGEGGTFGQRATAGAAGAFVGDAMGRMAGRVLNTAVGFAQDIASTVTRGKAANPAATAFEELGGTTLGHQRMAQGTPAQRVAERAAQGAEAAVNPPTVMREAMEANDALFRARAAEAVGLEGNFDRLDQGFVNQALDRFQQGFSAVARTASETDAIPIDASTATKLRSLPEIRELIDLGDFEGLAGETPTISGAEWMTAREALAEAASTRFANGRSKAGEKIANMMDGLDNDIGDSVPDEFLADYAKLREQYRVFRLLERPNVISNDGQVNVRTLRRALDSKAQGFGRTATGGGTTTNPESRNLIDLMHAADNPEMKAFNSSGTAENLAFGSAVDQGMGAAGALAGGDVRPALGMAGKFLSPGIVGASQRGNGRMFEGAMTPNVPLRAAGQGTGRGLLDELFYPFIGADDDRRPQQ